VVLILEKIMAAIRGQYLCSELETHNVTADWTIDSQGELFLIIDNWVLRAYSKPPKGRPEDYKTEYYWLPVVPSLKSIIHREQTGVALEWEQL
jgi:hypothetical protein